MDVVEERVEFVNQTVYEFACSLYEIDGDGNWVNLSSWKSGEIKIQVPFGDAGTTVYRLKQKEARYLGLRYRFIVRMYKPGSIFPLFEYNSETRLWHINTSPYGSIDLVKAYFYFYKMTVEEYAKMDARMVTFKEHLIGTPF